MADLGDFYPGATQTSLNGAGKPAAPGASSGGSPAGGVGAPFHQSPALVVLLIVAGSFLLLHHSG